MNGKPRRLRMAVVGQGHFAQVAVLPALQKTRSVDLAALVSGDPDKLQVLGDRYRVPRANRCSYEQYDALLASGAVDAVYIVLPNDLHADFAIRTARAGVHVLCEKPLAPTVEECESMIEACEAADVKLMTAYRLHFEAANLTAVEVIRSGEIGDPRFFNSVFAMQVREGNIRVQPRPGAGPLFDLGIYCINAARYLFRDEPGQVTATMIDHETDPRFEHVEETVAATMRFPGDRVASFTASFGAADRARYEVVGTDGYLVLENAYEYAADQMTLHVYRGAKHRKKKWKKRDQIAAEIEYFGRCVRDGVDPEPSGYEGLADVRIMHAIQEAATSGRMVPVIPVDRERRPTPAQEIHVPGHDLPETVSVQSPSK